MKHYTELMYMKGSGLSSVQWDYRRALLARAAYSWGKLNFCVALSWDAFIGGSEYETFGESLDDAIACYNEGLVDGVGLKVKHDMLPVLFVAFPDEDGNEMTISLASVGIPLPQLDVFAAWAGSSSKAMDIWDARDALEEQAKS